MAHFVKLNENNIVTAVYVVNNQELDPLNEEESGIKFLVNWSNGHTNWIQTSYNHNIRKQFAGIGYTYDSVNDVFIAPQPYPSWSLDQNFDWQPPIARPTEGKWIWDEELGEWLDGETL